MAIFDALHAYLNADKAFERYRLILERRLAFALADWHHARNVWRITFGPSKKPPGGRLLRTRRLRKKAGHPTP